MTKLNITPAQYQQLLEMCGSFFPEKNFKVSSLPTGMIHYDIIDHFGRGSIHWFELCVTHIAEKVAQEFAKQPFGTHSYAKFYIVQALFSQLYHKHPIDFLYDMWKNPQAYAQNL